MAIESSILTERAIKYLLENYYNIRVSKVDKLNRGSANIFGIESGERKYIVKEFSEGKTLDSIIMERNIINFLSQRGFIVPQYIDTAGGSICCKYNNRIIVLQECIDGYTIDNNTGDYKRVIECADLLGRMTKALQDYPTLDEHGIMEKWFSRDSIAHGITKIEDAAHGLDADNPYKAQIEEDFADKIKISRGLLSRFDFEGIHKLSIVNAHGDYSVQQLIYSEKNQTAVIDFETAKRLPIVWEIMRSYSYIDKEAENGELNIDTLIQYFRTFSKYMKLNEYDLKYAAYMYIIQLVSSTFGYKEYNTDHTQEELLRFAMFRTNLCRYLYEKSDEIGLRLSKEINPYRYYDFERE